MNLEIIYNFAKKILEDDKTAHDWQHALRVEANALKISPSSLAKEEFEIIKASCWLHDTIDPKISIADPIGLKDLTEILNTAGASIIQIEKIIYIIQNLSYSKNIEEKKELDLLGEIVQDADRLDAIGAIGIARAFYYGGSKHHLLYNDKPPRTQAEITEINYRTQDSIVNHFYEKLLHLEGSMNTVKAKEIARSRTEFMHNFLDNLFKEIDCLPPV